MNNIAVYFININTYLAQIWAFITEMKGRITWERKQSRQPNPTYHIMCLSTTMIKTRIRKYFSCSKYLDGIIIRNITQPDSEVLRPTEIFVVNSICCCKGCSRARLESYSKGRGTRTWLLWGRLDGGMGPLWCGRGGFATRRSWQSPHTDLQKR